MDNENLTPEQKKAQRLKAMRFQRNVRIAAILLAIVLSIISLVQSCSTRKAIEDLAAQLAAKKAAQQTEMISSPSAEAEKPGTITLSFIGNLTLSSPYGTTGGMEVHYNRYGETYFLQNIRSLLEEDDLTVGCISTALTEAAPEEGAEDLFRAPGSYATILSEGGVDAISVAHPRVFSFGEEGYVDTLAHLDNAGIDRFGGDYTTICQVGPEEALIPVGLTAVDVTAAGENALAMMQNNMDYLRERGAKLIVSQYYFGSDTDTATKTSLCQGAVDHGAHLVVGYGSTLEGVAEYKGAYIVYSLGNFINGNSDVGEDTFIFQKDFCMDQGVVVSLGEGRIIPVLTSPDMTKNTFLPTLASGADEKRILDRIYTAGKTIPGGITE